MGLNFQYRFDPNLNMGFSDKLVPDYDAGGIGQNPCYAEVV